jgi:galactokinase
MDQATVVLAKAGHLLLLDCDTLVTRDVPFDDPTVSVLIIDSRVKHQLVDSPFAQRRQQCEDAAAILGKRLRALTMHELDARREELDAVNFRRARHVVGEITRTADAVDAIAARNWELAGELMTASHASLRDDYEVSCSEVDALVNTCEALGMKAGVYGARITGGGFGGCVVALVETNQVAEIEAAISAAYRVETGLQAEFIHALPMAGAHCVDDCRRD